MADRLDRARSTWRELLSGNARFVAGEVTACGASEPTGEAQRPVAALLGCSDSRVPPQMVFDRGLGDLFTVRLAGAVADGGAVASLRFAVDHLGVPLIVVLGHQGCGAVTAAVDLVDRAVEPSPGLDAVVQPLLPACLATRDAADHVDAAVGESVRRTAAALARELDAPVVGAVYELGTGRVEEVPPGVYSCTYIEDLGSSSHHPQGETR